MSFENELKQLYQLYDALYDEESKVIFESRYKYSMGLINWAQMCDRIFPYIKNKRWHNIGFLDYFKSYSDAKQAEYLIFGAGDRGYISYKFLNELGFKVVAFADNDKSKQNTTFCGLPVFDPFEAVNKYKNCHVIVTVLNLTAQASIFRQLLLYNINPTHILMLRGGAAWGFCGTTYLDFPTFNPAEDEVFIDCGCYKGETVFDFLNWCGGKYKKIYAFEPDSNNFKICQDQFKDLDNISLIKSGLWKSNTNLFFSEDSTDSSKISKNGLTRIEVKTLDSILLGEKASFIKMDIEGSELEALEGATKTIINYRPKLAISVYHNRKDLYSIALFLKKIVDDYHFGLRTYSSIGADTVLYAW